MVTLPKIGQGGALSDRAYEVLKEAIVHRLLKPGQALNEEKLAEELGISRTPLRSALQQLYHEHLIRPASGKGYVVTSLSREDMEHVFLMRSVLEPAAARLAALHRTAGDVDKLHRLVGLQRQTVTAGDYLKFLDYDRDFHLTVASIPKNPYLETAVRTMQLHGHRFLVLDENVYGRAPESVEEHAAIAHAIEAGQPDEAGRLMAQHVERTRAKLAEALPWSYL